MLASNIYNHQSSSAFDFQMRTSSGDEINLKGYKESQLEIQRSEGENFQSTSISLRESYKYSFSYVGDGISEQDQKEIDEALKKIRPVLDFLEPDSDFEGSDKNILDKAMDINALLPDAKDDNHQKFIQDSLLKMMDDMLKGFEDADEMIQLARDVFDALGEQMRGLNLYA
jgi:hypothetical protein